MLHNICTLCLLYMILLEVRGLQHADASFLVFQNVFFITNKKQIFCAIFRFRKDTYLQYLRKFCDSIVIDYEDTLSA